MLCITLHNIYSVSSLHSSWLAKLTGNIPSLQIILKNARFSPHDLKSHGHTTNMMPQNMTMKQPDPLIVSSKPDDNVSFRRDVDGILSNGIAKIVLSAARRF